VATNVFILCLAISDLALSVFSLPIQLHYQLTNRWFLGPVLCRVVFAVFAVPMHLSTVTILLIAVDRYLLVVRPFSARLSACCASCLVAISVAVSVLHVWSPSVSQYPCFMSGRHQCRSIRTSCLVAISVAVSVLLAIPVVHNTSLHVIDNDPQLGITRMQLCIERWSNADFRRIYSVCTFTLQFCVPLILTAAFYARIYISLRVRRHLPSARQVAIRNQQNTVASVRNRITGTEDSRVSVLVQQTCGMSCLRCRASDAVRDETGLPHQFTSENDGARMADRDARNTTRHVGDAVTNTNGSSRRRRAGKTNRILAAIVINFVVCWLPWNVFGLLTELDSKLVRGRYFKLMDLALKAFAMSSACINPLLYCWFNETLRMDLTNVAGRLRLYQLTTLTGGRPS